MNDIIQKIIEWPIIVQGALGSLLFWITLNIGQKVTSKIVEKLSHVSKKILKSTLSYKLLKHQLMVEEGADYAATLSTLIFISIRQIVKSLIWLTLGIIFQSFITVFGIIGYIGALYHLFRAANALQPIDTKLDHVQKIAELDEKIKELE